MNSYEANYTKTQEIQIESEFTRTKNICYLDHAGTTLYSEKQISDALSGFTTNLYGNPHSKNTSSKYTEDSIDQIRYEILNHFNTNTDEYDIIFTSGATESLKLVSETFNYNNGTLIYLEDNHTSVLGMRANAPNIKVLHHNDAFDLLNNPIKSKALRKHETCNSLFVYSAQCNYSGTKYPLNWIKNVHKGALNPLIPNKDNWYCFLDAASYSSTNCLDLSRYKPDFVCVSFYKMFGYPTGLGGLLVRKDSGNILLKRYYGGGTVFMAISSKNIAIPRQCLHERFEDGTVSFLSILSLKYGFETLKRLNLNMDLISRHTFSLAKYVYNHLLRLHHSNGHPSVILYHDTNFENRNHQGAIVNFNVQRSNGEFIGYSEVLHISNLFGIQLRTGCFCNPGACQRHLNLSTDVVISQYKEGHICGDQNDLINGVPTGSVRISFGYMSTKKDADEFLSMIEECFVTKPVIKKVPKNYDNSVQEYRRKFYFNNVKEIEIDKNENYKDAKIAIENDARLKTSTFSQFNIQGVLNDVYIYPIKSCGAFKIINAWSLVSTGLKYDRQWMIVNKNGVCLTQKSDTNLCKIIPSIDLENGELMLSYGDLPTLSIPLDLDNEKRAKIYSYQSKVCGDSIIGYDCGEHASAWLCEALNETGLRLLKQASDESSFRKKLVDGESVCLSFANQAQFLLINKSSVEWLQNYLKTEKSPINLDDLIYRFRPNLVVDFDKAFLENDLSELFINGITFKFGGQCTRCQMICVDQKTGEKNAELLTILSKELKGNISFGVYLKHDTSNVDSAIAAKCNVLGSFNLM